MNILLVATASYAGMGPYASEIINSFEDEDSLFYFLVEDDREYYTNNIKQSLKSRCLIIKKKNSTINKLLGLFISPKEVVKALSSFCKVNNIDIIHFMTSETLYYKEIISFAKQYKVCYTVHDLHPHEAHKVFYKLWRHKIGYKRVFEIIKSIDSLITNSRDQYKELEEKYINKDIYFHEFPSLISKTVKYGNKVPEEIRNEEAFILFFGRIEQYKGIDLLYNTFISSDELNNNNKLVIAGAGDLYFKRSVEKEKNVIFMNRYIRDEEIAFLFKNAKCVVYPYISASQSGVLSLSCYFQTLTLASDVSFFKSAIEYGIGSLFKAGDTNDLQQKLMEILQTEPQTMKNEQKKYYERFYNTEVLRENILEIYKTIKEK